MTQTIKILAQVSPGAVFLTDLYTVPAATSAVVSSIVVCNRVATVSLFRILVAQAGGGLDPKQYLYYDVLIPPNDTFVATIGATLAATDVIRVYTNTTNLSFTVFGEQIT